MYSHFCRVYFFQKRIFYSDVGLHQICFMVCYSQLFPFFLSVLYYWHQYYYFFVFFVFFLSLSTTILFSVRVSLLLLLLCFNHGMRILFIRQGFVGANVSLLLLELYKVIKQNGSPRIVSVALSKFAVLADCIRYDVTLPSLLGSTTFPLSVLPPNFLRVDIYHGYHHSFPPLHSNFECCF